MTVVTEGAVFAPVVEVTPADAVEGDDLTCTVTTASTDADGDSMTYAFAWDVDGVDYASAADSAYSSVVDGADVSDGEEWTCEVTASDGTASGSAGSDSVTTDDGACSLMSEGTSTYAFCAETWASWDDGEDDCISRGGQHVTVSDAAEYAFLKLVSTAGSRIGLNDRGSEGTWVWVSGGSGYTYWAPGEPNSGGGTGSDEDCVIISNEGMRDVPCAQLTPYICEY